MELEFGEAVQVVAPVAAAMHDTEPLPPTA
jgi:hypothetical protein